MKRERLAFTAFYFNLPPPASIFKSSDISLPIQLTDEQTRELAHRIVYVLFEPEVEKTFCFIFVGKGDMHHITGGFTRSVTDVIQMSFLISNTFFHFFYE